MKILIVANYKESAGGISGQVKLLYEHLRKEGIYAEIFSTKASPLRRLMMFRALKLKAKDFDVIHVHCCSYIGFFPLVLASNVAKSLGKRLVMTYHGGGAEEFFRRYSMLAKHYLRKPDVNIVLSGFLEKVFSQYDIPCIVIPNILAVTGEVRKERIDIRPRFISVRSLQPNYNIGCIIKAFGIVKRHIPEATLDILGDGECRQDLEKIVSNLGISDVNFIGQVPNGEIDKYLDTNDIFISMPLIDNQPMSVLEAWRNGLLVISSNVGGMPYMVEDGVNGLLVENDNQEALAEKMIDAVAHKADSILMIRQGRESLKKYNWKHIKDSIFKTYHLQPQ